MEVKQELGEDLAGISFKVPKKFRTNVNIASQLLGKPVAKICIEALEKAVKDAGLAA